jgi:hypothetical protein
MIDPKVASLRSHSNNISRYRGLLRTNLSDLERQFIERRLNEERMAHGGPCFKKSSDHSDFEQFNARSAAFGAVIL